MIDRLGDILAKNSYSELPFLHNSEIRILSCLDWSDGPVCGLLLYKSKKYYYQFLFEDNEKETNSSQRKYLIIELTLAQLAEEERWEKLFREKVSDNPKYDVEGNLIAGCVKPPVMWGEFYKLFSNRSVSFSNNIVIGWFVQ